MSNIFTVTDADIRDILASESAYRELITDARYNAEIDPQNAIDQGVRRFVGWVGGEFTTAANIALGRPFACAFALHALHAIKAAGNTAYKIPESVISDRDEARDWARKTGASLLGAEGGSVPGAGSVEYVSPDADYNMDQLDNL